MYLECRQSNLGQIRGRRGHIATCCRAPKSDCSRAPLRPTRSGSHSQFRASRLSRCSLSRSLLLWLFNIFMFISRAEETNKTQEKARTTRKKISDENDAICIKIIKFIYFLLLVFNID